MAEIEWLRRLTQQIQAFDYELHAALRLLAKGELDAEHLSAFVDANLRRERMMAHVLAYVAERRKQTAIRRPPANMVLKTNERLHSLTSSSS